ncbi:MAG: HD domain-containing protein [Clostridiales bacterium]|nr:HD domain-containing protein [Clostridiales bacterium]HBM81042.1 phosphohydrolase [Clostridiaceae bacterium]
MIDNGIKNVPTLNDAKKLLNEAEKLNPGPWVGHSLYAGKAAELIAQNCPELNSDTALVLGMLHDIGRRFGVTDMRHAIDGYNFCMDKGYTFLAKICMTHSFNYKDIRAAFGKWDCSKKEYDFVKEYLQTIEYDDYDRLIQLCDVLALPDGFCLIEKRMVDVALRHGIHEGIIPKWKATFETKDYFERKIGKSIYSLLPGVVENTFGL